MPNKVTTMRKLLRYGAKGKTTVPPFQAIGWSSRFSNRLYQIYIFVCVSVRVQVWECGCGCGCRCRCRSGCDWAVFALTSNSLFFSPTTLQQLLVPFCIFRLLCRELSESWSTRSNLPLTVAGIKFRVPIFGSIAWKHVSADIFGFYCKTKTQQKHKIATKQRKIIRATSKKKDKRRENWEELSGKANKPKLTLMGFVQATKQVKGNMFQPTLTVGWIQIERQPPKDLCPFPPEIDRHFKVVVTRI